MFLDIGRRDWSNFHFFRPNVTQATLQPMSVPKAQIRKLPFWAFSDVRDQFAYISMGSARIALEIS
jgi:hypothetical protein